MSLPIINPYAKARIVQRDKPQMGPQSQRRLTLAERTHQLQASSNKRRKKGGQMTLFGDVAFDPLTDCERCRGVAHGRDPHRAHDIRCSKSKHNKNGAIISPRELEQRRIDKELAQHFNTPLRKDERASWKFVTPDSMAKFFAKRKAAPPEAPVVPTDVNQTPTKDCGDGAPWSWSREIIARLEESPFGIWNPI